MVKIKICIFGIMKNEEKIVERYLNSVKDIADYIAITDTGNSVEMNKIIRQWGIDNNIPTVVCEGEEFQFKNFGHNRTQSYQNAVKHFPYADYYATFDADMCLRIEDSWKMEKNKLDADIYELIQTNKYIKYWNVRMFSSRIKWTCKGVTHEYWCEDESNKKQIKREQLKSIWIDDKEDGGNKSNKFTRDIKLLTDGINDENTSNDLKIRYRFYLAQSYQNGGFPEKAIPVYLDRIKDGGWFEEVYYSYFSIGNCYKQLKDDAKAIEYYLKAYNYRPQRAESIYQIAKMYREKGENNTAMIFINLGKNIKYPDNDKLFIDYNVYDYLFYYEMSISAYYTSEKEKGKIATQLILSSQINAPKDTKEYVKTKIAPFYGIKV